MDPIQNIELQDMMAIVHGLKMSGLAFVEADALDAINDRIKNLPSSELLTKVYTDPREVKRLCAEVGRIMELIDYYGTQNEESKARHKAKTKLPPRYKNLKWEKANSHMEVKTAQNVPDASSQTEAITQETKDIQMSIEQTQMELQSFVDKLNQQIPQIIQYLPPQYQGGLVQQQAIMNGAAQSLNESAETLRQDAQQIGEAAMQAGEVSRTTMEMSEMYSSQLGNAGGIGGIAASKDYIKNIVRLSSNLEGNGIISEKLVIYAKNLRDRNPQAIYDAREIDILLRHAKMNREADVLIKTAGIWDNMKGGLQQAWQGAKTGLQGGQTGVIDPGEQKGPKWQTGDIETQFKNDVDWLKRSWDNLVDFFGRYVRDAGTLEGEWAGKDAPEKMAKIQELKQQAEIMLANAKKIQNSANFDGTETLMADEFSKIFGGGQAAAGDEATSNNVPKDIQSIANGTGNSAEEINNSLLSLKTAKGEINKLEQTQVGVLKKVVEYLMAGPKKAPEPVAEVTPPGYEAETSPVTAPDATAPDASVGAAATNFRIVEASFADLDQLSKAMVMTFATGQFDKIEYTGLQTLMGYLNTYDPSVLEKIKQDNTPISLNNEEIQKFQELYKAAITPGAGGYPEKKHLKGLKDFLVSVRESKTTKEASSKTLIKEAAVEMDYSIEGMDALSKGQWTVGNLNKAIGELEEIIKIQEEARTEAGPRDESIAQLSEEYNTMFMAEVASGEIASAEKFGKEYRSSAQKFEFLDLLKKAVESKATLESLLPEETPEEAPTKENPEAPVDTTPTSTSMNRVQKALDQDPTGKSLSDQDLDVMINFLKANSSRRTVVAARGDGLIENMIKRYKHKPMDQVKPDILQQIKRYEQKTKITPGQTKTFGDQKTLDAHRQKMVAALKGLLEQDDFKSSDIYVLLQKMKKANLTPNDKLVLLKYFQDLKSSRGLATEPTEAPSAAPAAAAPKVAPEAQASVNNLVNKIMDQSVTAEDLQSLRQQLENLAKNTFAQAFINERFKIEATRKLMASWFGKESAGVGDAWPKSLAPAPTRTTEEAYGNIDALKALMNGDWSSENIQKALQEVAAQEKSLLSRQETMQRMKEKTVPYEMIPLLKKWLVGKPYWADADFELLISELRNKGFKKWTDTSERKQQILDYLKKNKPAGSPPASPEAPPTAAPTAAPTATSKRNTYNLFQRTGSKK